jgi:hypothetical protein
VSGWAEDAGMRASAAFMCGSLVLECPAPPACFASLFNEGRVAPAAASNYSLMP